MQMPSLANAPLHIRAAALALWHEWLTDGRKSKDFNVTISVRGPIAIVQDYHPLMRSRADAESGDVTYIGGRKPQTDHE